MKGGAGGGHGHSGPGPHYEKMSSRERFVCSTLCMCLLLSVLSAVAMIYLSVIIYIPAHRELTSGLTDRPVMCTTREFRHIHGDIVACRWSSCSEWCLSKGGGDCQHLYVSVRSNGTDLQLEDCEQIKHRRCRSLDLDKVQESNCKQDGECVDMSGFHRCEDGLCRNISSVYTCQFSMDDADAAVSCVKKRNCVELDGMFDCRDGNCARVHKWNCERRCADINTADKNVVLVAGDDILLGLCRRAIDRRSGLIIWDGDRHRGRTLVASCTDIYNETSYGLMTGYDCINGSVLPSEVLLDRLHPRGYSNYSYLVRTIERHGSGHRLDPNGDACPFEQDITIYNHSRLMINTEGCVNTLREECERFFEVHGQDGRNHTSPSRFPCYFSPANGEFVVSKFDATKTKWLFLMFFVVPAALLILSCGFLFMCSRMLNVDNTGHMILKCCWKSDLDFSGVLMDDTKSLAEEENMTEKEELTRAQEGRERSSSKKKSRSSSRDQKKKRKSKTSVAREPNEV